MTDTSGLNARRKSPRVALRRVIAGANYQSQMLALTAILVASKMVANAFDFWAFVQQANNFLLTASVLATVAVYTPPDRKNVDSMRRWNKFKKQSHRVILVTLAAMLVAPTIDRMKGGFFWQSSADLVDKFPFFADGPVWILGGGLAIAFARYKLAGAQAPSIEELMAFNNPRDLDNPNEDPKRFKSFLNRTGRLLRWAGMVFAYSFVVAKCAVPALAGINGVPDWLNATNALSPYAIGVLGLVAVKLGPKVSSPVTRRLSRNKILNPIRRLPVYNGSRKVDRATQAPANTAVNAPDNRPAQQVHSSSADQTAEASTETQTSTAAATVGESDYPAQSRGARPRWRAGVASMANVLTGHGRLPRAGRSPRR